MSSRGARSEIVQSRVSQSSVAKLGCLSVIHETTIADVARSWLTERAEIIDPSNYSQEAILEAIARQAKEKMDKIRGIHSGSAQLEKPTVKAVNRVVLQTRVEPQVLKVMTGVSVVSGITVSGVMRDWVEERADQLPNDVDFFLEELDKRTEERRIRVISLVREAFPDIFPNVAAQSLVQP